MGTPVKHPYGREEIEGQAKSRQVRTVNQVYFMLGALNLQDQKQCCDLETMVSRLECTRVHFIQVSVSVSVSRPEGQGLGLGVKTSCLVPTPVARLP